jgi:hypothetical protein
MARWLKNKPPIKRLAFAATLLQIVSSKAEAYQQLGKYLPGVTVDPDTSDFMFRLNRQSDSHSGIPGLRINRLCTWGALKFKFDLHANPMGSEQFRDVPLRDDQNACVIELDINTAPEFDAPQLPSDSLATIYAELVDKGLEAAEKGDRK